MKNKVLAGSVFISFFFFISCSGDQQVPAKEETSVIREDTFTVPAPVEISGMDADSNSIYIYCDTNTLKGYVKLIHGGYNEYHKGTFNRNPEYAQFEFIADSSVSFEVCMSRRYGDGQLTVNGNGGFDEAQINLHYHEFDFDTTIIVRDTLNIIPLRASGLKYDAIITASFNNYGFHMKPLDIDYYRTGINMSTSRYFDTLYCTHAAQGTTEELIIQGMHAKHHMFKNDVEVYTLDN